MNLVKASRCLLVAKGTLAIIGDSKVSDIKEELLSNKVFAET